MTEQEYDPTTDVFSCCGKMHCICPASNPFPALRTDGRANPISPAYDPTYASFMARVRIESTGCWKWIGPVFVTGYGQTSITGLTARAHRASYVLHVGPISEGLTLDHLCKNKLCVNPAHLEPVTMRENILRSDSPPAQNARKTQCSRGHKLGGDNIPTKVRQLGHRTCLACTRINGTIAKRDTSTKLRDIPCNECGRIYKCAHR